MKHLLKYVAVCILIILVIATLYLKSKKSALAKDITSEPEWAAAANTPSPDQSKSAGFKGSRDHGHKDRKHKEQKHKDHDSDSDDDRDYRNRRDYHDHCAHRHYHNHHDRPDLHGHPDYHGHPDRHVHWSHSAHAQHPPMPQQQPLPQQAMQQQQQQPLSHAAEADKPGDHFASRRHQKPATIAQHLAHIESAPTSTTNYMSQILGDMPKVIESFSITMPNAHQPDIVSDIAVTNDLKQQHSAYLKRNAGKFLIASQRGIVEDVDIVPQYGLRTYKCTQIREDPNSRQVSSLDNKMTFCRDREYSMSDLQG